ncbi:iron uptake transporter permease EfeU [Psychromicrobium sp. YIM B11713]|uniref:iron uptake transporter permease EfeU n=1 Tax=Psychromicrobium sp. YIM B11713 TaxID=3145233 RepID=UPI00374F4B14
MLATLVIGLREGLEAALIVGIIAAFLKRNGKSLGAMWFGVVSAVAISIGVGVTLELISVSLPQSQQEGMESIIGAIAVVMVTGMIFWMSKNARTLKGELETQAAGAVRNGSTLALAVMAFLAVLREGVETSVFMLAAFQSSRDALSAGLGAVIGVAIAIAIGYGIYRGGVKLNMARFFRVTGVFLVLVAAGLVLMSLRTAHEAGWISVGQDNTVNLSWLAPNGSPQSALLTGVLGIPADPKLIEVLGWALYLVPMLLFVLWPQKHKISDAALPRFRRILGASLAAAAIVLAITVALISQPGPSTASLPLSSGTDQQGSLTLNGELLTLSTATGPTDYRLPEKPLETADHAGVKAQHFSLEIPAEGSQPQQLSLQQLVTLNSGRLPVGISAQRNPGPFEASWHNQGKLEVWIAEGALLDASKVSGTDLTLSGGGLPTPRSIPIDQPAESWQAVRAGVSSAASAIETASQRRDESLLWGLWLPAVLLTAGLIFALLSFRRPETVIRSSSGGSETPTVATHSVSKGPLRV